MYEKITADMLTEEYGFVNGEWFFVEWSSQLKCPKYEVINFRRLNNIRSINYIEKIKPLTGPMSIWNHAPEWAEKVCVMRDSIQWCFRDTLILGAEELQYIKRPWWAQNA